MAVLCVCVCACVHVCCAVLCVCLYTNNVKEVLPPSVLVRPSDSVKTGSCGGSVVVMSGPARGCSLRVSYSDLF